MVVQYDKFLLCVCVCSLSKVGFFVHGIIHCNLGWIHKSYNRYVAENNQSETVIRVFHAAQLKWGIPACLRTDGEGEKVLVADYLL